MSFQHAEYGIELLNANAQLRAADGRLVVDDGTGTERAIALHCDRTVVAFPSPAAPSARPPSPVGRGSG